LVLVKRIEPNNFKGISFMLLHALAVATLLSLMKLLTKDLSSNHVVFFYKGLLCLMILPWAVKDGLKDLVTKRLGVFIVGALFGTVATLCLMAAIKHLPLANVVILGYMEKILLTAVGFFYFKEKISKGALIAIVLSFIGAVIVVYPEINKESNFNGYYYLVFVSIILWVLYSLIVKYLGKTESIKVQVFYTTLFSMLFSMPVAFVNWQTKVFMGLELLYPMGLISWQAFSLDLQYLPLIFLLSICYLIISISLFKSFLYGDIVIVMPFGYTKIVFAALIGLIFFAEYPTLYNCIGCLIIIFSSSYLAYCSKSS
jgi:drug/metabolite transporter (DMT)-like permease